MPTPSHDNDDPTDDDFDFLSEESEGMPAPKTNVNELDPHLDQTLNIKPAAKLPIIRQPVPVSESGPNLSPAERAANGSSNRTQPINPQPITDEFDDDFDFLDDTRAHEQKQRNAEAAVAAPTSEFGNDWNDGIHDYSDEYEDGDQAQGGRKPLLLALAGFGALAMVGFVAFQSGLLDFNKSANTDTQNVPGLVTDAVAVPAPVGTPAESTGASSATNTAPTVAEQFRSNLARIEGLVANGEFETASVAIDALDSRVLGYGQPEFTALKEQIQARNSGTAASVDREAEAQRLAAEAVRADQERIAQERIAQELRQAEEARLAAENQNAETARLAEEARLVEEARLAAQAQRAEEQRLVAEAERQAEEARLAALAAEAQRAEEARLAAEAQRAEEARLAAETRQAEAARLAAEAQRAEQARLAAEAQRAEEERLVAEAQRQAEQARAAEEARAAERARAAEAEILRAEEARLAAESRRLQAAQEAEQARRVEDEFRNTEADRLERERLEAIAAEQRANARRDAAQRAEQGGNSVTIQQAPSASDREATDRLASAANAAASAASSAASNAASSDRAATDRLTSAATAPPAPSNQGLVVRSRGISDAEAAQVDRRLLAVKEAIRARNMSRLTELTAISGAQVQTFFQLFTNSSRIDVRVDGSRAQASVGVIVGTLQINRIVGNNGSDRAVPSNLRNFTLTTRREGNGWSKFAW